MSAAVVILAVLFVVIPLALAISHVACTTKVTTHTPRREAVAYWAERNRAQRNGVRL